MEGKPVGPVTRPVSEAELFAGYRVSAEQVAEVPQVGYRSERCCCGGVIVAPVDSKAIMAAVREHQGDREASGVVGAGVLVTSLPWWAKYSRFRKKSDTPGEYPSAKRRCPCRGHKTTPIMEVLTQPNIGAAPMKIPPARRPAQ